MTVTWNQAKIKELITAGAAKGLVKAAESVRTEAIKLVTHGSHSGRTYRKNGRVHKASAPGEPPASDTGRLARRINTRYDFKALIGSINVSVEYGPFLEYGTRLMEPRPFMRPALANKRQFIVDTIKREIAASLKKVNKAK